MRGRVVRVRRPLLRWMRRRSQRRKQTLYECRSPMHVAPLPLLKRSWRRLKPPRRKRLRAPLRLLPHPQRVTRLPWHLYRVWRNACLSWKRVPPPPPTPHIRRTWGAPARSPQGSPRAQLPRRQISSGDCARLITWTAPLRRVMKCLSFPPPPPPRRTWMTRNRVGAAGCGLAPPPHR